MLRPGRAHLGHGGLQLGIEHLHHAAPFGAGVLPGESEIAHQLAEPLEAPRILARLAFGELDEQDGLGILAHHRVDGRLEHGDLARQAQHGAVDQLDRDRAELDDVLGHVHRLVEAAEVAGADRARADQRRELELDRRREGERAFRSDQDMRQIEIVAARHQGVEIIAADPPLDLGEPGLDLAGLRGRERQQIGRERPQRRGRRNIRQIARDRPEMRPAAVGQHRIDRLHVLARIAVAQRAGAAGIVAHHAADGGARGGRDVDREPQAVGLEPPVELVEHDAGLDPAAGIGDIDLDQAVEIFRAVDDQQFVDGLARIARCRRRAAAP